MIEKLFTLSLAYVGSRHKPDKVFRMRFDKSCVAA